MSTPTDERQRLWFAFFLLTLLPAGNALYPSLDVDTWWHLAVGRYIMAHGLPSTDPFSQLGQTKHVSWIAYSWLYELLLYGTFQITGTSGILALKHLLGLLTFTGLSWFFLRKQFSWLSMGVLALVTISLIPFMTERPWHFTIVFTMLTLVAVQDLRNGVGWKRYAWLPLIYVAWANIHIQFVMGLGLLSLGSAVSLLERVIYKHQPNSHVVLRIGGLLLACMLATLVNPYHIGLYRVVWEYATQTRALQLVMELQPPDFRSWWNWPFLILLVAAAYYVATNGYRLWDLALLGAALFFGLRMQRDLWFGTLCCGAILISQRALRQVTGQQPVPRLRAILCVGVCGLCLIRVLWESGLAPKKSLDRTLRENYPVAAVEWIRTNQDQLHGPMFNHFDWGGYLIWNLPTFPVSIDGRTNLYGEARLVRSVNTWAALDWETDEDLRRAGFVLAPKKIQDRTFALTEALRSAKDDWEICYEDSTTVIFVQRHAVKERAP